MDQNISSLKNKKEYKYFQTRVQLCIPETNEGYELLIRMVTLIKYLPCENVKWSTKSTYIQIQIDSTQINSGVHFSFNSDFRHNVVF